MGGTEPSGERSLWREVPSRFVIGEEDHIIPAALQRYMAERGIGFDAMNSNTFPRSMNCRKFPTNRPSISTSH